MQSSGWTTRIEPSPRASAWSPKPTQSSDGPGQPHRAPDQPPEQARAHGVLLGNLPGRPLLQHRGGRRSEIAESSARRTAMPAPNGTRESPDERWSAENRLVRALGSTIMGRCSDVS